MKLAGPSGKDFELHHMADIMANLDKELQKIEGRTISGMLESAMYIFDEMDKTPPRIPVDMGNLRASFFIVSSKGVGDDESGGVGGRFRGKNAGQLEGEKRGIVGKVKAVSMATRQPTVAMGFSANYAVYVHENLEANFAGGAVKRTKSGKATAATRKFSRRSGAGPRFFSSHLERGKQRIVQIMADNAAIK